MSNALTRAAMLLLVAAFPARKVEDEETTVDFTVQCQFTVFGKRLPECDITAALGIALIAVVAYCLMLQTPLGG